MSTTAVPIPKGAPEGPLRKVEGVEGARRLAHAPAPRRVASFRAARAHRQLWTRVRRTAHQSLTRRKFNSG
jgi:hypothetical protein